MPAAKPEIAAIFNEAIALGSDEERARYLEQACGDDLPLRARVEALLSAHSEAGGFFGGKSPAAVATQIHTLTKAPGTVIGPYKLLQEIGQGGMGVVYMAEQHEPVRRKVALKIIKPGMDTRQVIARFEAERQALSLMDHPNIAKVLDAGATESGRPYFVMELVKGQPITDYCDEHHLTPRQRLELLLPVCQAIQHAHQKGIIHRDIKPSNILIAEYDQQAVPKVIDFGVAKAISQSLTEKTMFTGLGQIVGTLEYMSPEQATVNQLDIDTRSDIYSLGVLMYELLTGSTPFDKERLRSAAWDEMLRIIREEEPPRPSTKLSSSETLASVSANRSMEPARLSRTVRGELDWIIMKALEKDRARRYETVSSLALDVQRYLADEPVLACPPSAWYRFRMFARRNKASLTAASLVALALVLGTLVSTWQAIRATHAEKQALVQAVNAQAVSGLLQDMLASGHPDQLKGADYTVRELLDEFSERLDKQLKEQPEVEATIRLIMGSAYWRLAVLDKSERHLTISLALRRQVFGDGHEQVAEVLVASAWTLRDMGQVEESLARAREALAIYRQRGVRDRHLIKAMWTVQTFLPLQDSLSYQDKHAEADALGQEALAIARESPDGEYPEVANIMHTMAYSKLSQGQPKEAEQLARQAVTLHHRVHGKEHPETGWGVCILGMALQAQGQYPEAATRLREAHDIFRKHHRYGHYSHTFAFDNLLSVFQAQGNEKEIRALLHQRLTDTNKAVERSPDDPEVWFQRGVAHAGLHRHREAIADYEKTISLLEQLTTFPSKREQRLQHIGAHNESANSHAGLGNYAEAEQLYKKTLELRKAVLGADHQDTLWTMHNLANVYAAQGRHDEAAKLGEVTLALQRVKLSSDHPDTLWRMHHLANSYAALERYAEAVALHEETLAPRKNKPGADRFDTAQSMNNLAWLLAMCPDAKVRDGSRAVELAQRAVALAAKAGEYWQTLGVARYRAGDWQSAITALEKSIALDNGEADRCLGWFFLAMAHWQLGNKREAREWYDKAVDALSKRSIEDETMLGTQKEAAALLLIDK